MTGRGARRFDTIDYSFFFPLSYSLLLLVPSSVTFARYICFPSSPSLAKYQSLLLLLLLAYHPFVTFPPCRRVFMFQGKGQTAMRAQHRVVHDRLKSSIGCFASKRMVEINACLYSCACVHSPCIHSLQPLSLSCSLLPSLIPPPLSPPSLSLSPFSLYFCLCRRERKREILSSFINSFYCNGIPSPVAGI